MLATGSLHGHGKTNPPRIQSGQALVNIPGVACQQTRSHSSARKWTYGSAMDGWYPMNKQ